MINDKVLYEIHMRCNIKIDVHFATRNKIKRVLI